MQSPRFSLRVLTYSARQPSWCTALMLTARCAWSKNFAAPAGTPSTFRFISWKIEFEISGRDESKRAKGKERREFLLPLHFALCSLLVGQERNRTADAGLFRAAYRIAAVV